MPIFQWDADKNRTNKAKHGISFETASLIWDDPDYLVFQDAIYDGEERWLAVGAVGLTTVPVAVHTIRDDRGMEIVRIISARKRHLTREDGMSKRPLTEEQLAELRALEALEDKDIDTSDIPEITDDRWLLARKGNLYKPVKQPVTIRLDADIIEWFKEHSSGRGYQTEINTALRRYVMEQEKRSG